MATHQVNTPNLSNDHTHGFRYRVVETCLDQKTQKAQINTTTHNAIFFQLEGGLKISWDEHAETIIKPGDIYFLPRGANVSACIIGKKIKYIAARLDHDLDNKATFNELLNSEECAQHYEYIFTALKMKEPMKILVESIKQYIIDGVNTAKLTNLKFTELYIIFRNYYTKQERINLFYPILKKNSKFKTFILDNYNVSVSIEELAKKANMSRSTFDRSFKAAFGMTPHKWFEIQTRILIMRKASEPNVTVKDMRYEVGVYNASQFTQLCKRLCGMPPSQLIKG